MNQEEVPPWKHSNDNFVIALTGAVLMFLMGKEGSEPSAKFINILEKTQVYARMKPEEKAILIKQL
jgi:cation-transporting ATPase 13A3/4/5